PAGRTRGALVLAPGRQAPRRRPRRARSPRGRTVRGPSAPRGARALLPLRAHTARRAHARMVEAQARLRIPARFGPGRPATPGISPPGGLAVIKDSIPVHDGALDHRASAFSPATSRGVTGSMKSQQSAARKEAQAEM